jgi:octaprenyl-diphosphate synthase
VGAVVAGADEPVEARLAEYAWNLGIAFQLVDDVLDFTAREKVLGKPVGSDLREGKVTLPVIYALEDGQNGEREMVATVLREGNYGTVDFDDVLQMVKRQGGVARAMDRAQVFADKARAIITTFPDSPYQRALAAVTDLVTDRDH